MKTMNVVLTLQAELLGTKPGNPEVHSAFVAGLAPDALSREEEVAATGVDAVIELGKTLFSRNAQGKPVIWDYQIKGFLKDAAGSMQRVPDSRTVKGKLKAYKKVIDQVIFVYPRQIEIRDTGDQVGSCQRPMRGQTPQGERVALINSESTREGSELRLQIKLLDEKLEEYVVEWLNYGECRGLGQWRNSGMGRFVWREMTAQEAQDLQRCIDEEKASLQKRIAAKKVSVA